MKQKPMSARMVFKEIGNVRWTQFDAFEVRMKRGAIFLLSPNGNEHIPSNVHIDEIFVPESLRGKGAGTDAMGNLCRLADKYKFTLDGGPIGWSDSPWRDKFVDWVLRFGFKRNPDQFLAKVDDPGAFYVRRLPL